MQQINYRQREGGGKAGSNRWVRTKTPYYHHCIKGKGKCYQRKWREPDFSEERTQSEWWNKQSWIKVSFSEVEQEFQRKKEMEDTWELMKAQED